MTQCLPAHATQCSDSHQKEAVLKATAVRSPLPVMLLILPCPPCLPGQGGPGGRPGQGVQAGGSRLGGPGWGAGDILSNLPYILHYHMVLAIKGLRTIRLHLGSFGGGVVAPCIILCAIQPCLTSHMNGDGFYIHFDSSDAKGQINTQRTTTQRVMREWGMRNSPVVLRVFHALCLPNTHEIFCPPPTETVHNSFHFDIHPSPSHHFGAGHFRPNYGI